MATTSVTTPTLDAQGLINAAMQDLSVSQTMLAHAGFGGGIRALTSADKPTPAAATYSKLSSSLVTLSPTPRVDAKSKPKLPSVITMNWSPITFSGFEVHGAAALSLHSDGSYSFHGEFVDPSAWDYDDSLSWGVRDSKGVLYMFNHTGGMEGWFDRWIEGGSDVDSWDKTGTNQTIKAKWADLCDGYYWHAHAGINWDIAGLETMVEDIIKAVGAIVQVITVVA